jgi:hypothetical protein
MVKKRPEGIPVKLPWEGGRWRSVGTFLKKNGMFPVWVGGRNIQNLLPKYKGPSPKPVPPRANSIPRQLMSGGIYRLMCNQCNDQYVGQTVSFFQRFEQHIGDIRNRRDAGALVPHMIKEHGFQGFNADPVRDPFAMSPVFFCQDANTKNLIESALIHHGNARLLNREAGPAISPLARAVAGALPFETDGVGSSRAPRFGLTAAPTAHRNRISAQQLTVAPGVSLAMP